MPPPENIPRYAPHRELPPYSYVSGLFPHPIRDPAGHAYGQHPEPKLPPDLTRPAACPTFLYGLDLFNAGYYWEAHEVWESLWHACGRQGTGADFLKGLIKLAAAGVKAREARPSGVQSHAQRAAELFRHVAQVWPPAEPLLGLSLPELIQHSDTLSTHPIADTQPDPLPVKIMFPFRLQIQAQ